MFGSRCFAALDLGTPVSGYASETDRPGAQRGEYADFVQKQLYPTLKAAADGNLQGGGADRLGVTFGGPIITEYEAGA